MAQSGSSWSWAVPVDTEASVTDGGEYPEAKSTDAVIMGVGARFAGGFCKAAGADGFLIVDLPPEEGKNLLQAAARYGLANIPLIAPNCSDERIQEIASVLKIDPILYNGTWSQIDQALHPLGVLVYSGLYR